MTSPSSLLPAAAASLVPLAGRLVDAVTDGIRFSDFLSKDRDRPTGPTDTPPPSSPAQPFEGRSEHLSQLIDRELGRFLERFEARLAQRGIDSSFPIEVKVDPHGQLVVDGNHPQRSAVEEILREDRELGHLFRRSTAAVAAYQRIANPADRTSREIRLRIENGSGTFEIV